MILASGRFVDLARLRPEDIDITDVAHSLSLLCRYGGHTCCHYSVAQHSVRVARLVSPELMLEGLLHDAAEMIVQDLIRPVKRRCPEYKKFEKELDNIFRVRFGLRPETDCGEVEYFDNAIIRMEIKQFMKSPGREQELAEPCWLQYEDVPLADYAWSPGEAEGQFLMTFAEAIHSRAGMFKMSENSCNVCDKADCEGCIFVALKAN